MLKQALNILIVISSTAMFVFMTYLYLVFVFEYFVKYTEGFKYNYELYFGFYVFFLLMPYSLFLAHFLKRNGMWGWGGGA